MKVNCLSLFFIFLLLLSSSVIRSAEFEHYYREQGLSQASIFDLLHDSQGFIWAATDGGLNRFDGYQFKVYLHNAKISNSLSNDNINTLFEDQHKQLWVGTNNGLNLFDKRSESFTHYKPIANNKNSLSHQNVTTITQDKAGIYWVGTESG
ncbi:MAG: hypothetical protein KC469_13505 [Flavobacteriaceae bacterium]|nr:hypothetical protein [Flavobacteriaceae bacterium]